MYQTIDYCEVASTYVHVMKIDQITDISCFLCEIHKGTNLLHVLDKTIMQYVSHFLHRCKNVEIKILQNDKKI